MDTNRMFAAQGSDSEWRRLDKAMRTASVARQLLPVGSSKADYARVNGAWSHACAALEACESRIAAECK